MLRFSRNDDRQGEVGRSMIEMLGVLAIIGVLSVGGIAGYSKAMEQFKINKTVNDYTFLIHSLIEYEQSLKKSEAIGLVDFAKNANLVPHNWKKMNTQWFSDGQGNHLQLYINRNNLYNFSDLIVFDIALGGYTKNDDNPTISPNFSAKLCTDIYRKLVIPLHSVLKFGNLFSSKNGVALFGDYYCQNNKKCLKDLSLNEIDTICNSCNKDAARCAISLAF